LFTSPASRTSGLAFLGWTLVFALAHTQAPRYFSNQHQYFVHGLARGGLGSLDRDWLANTADPTPIFTGLVAVTHRYLSDYLFHIYFAVLLGVYLYGLLGIFTYLTKGAATPLLRFSFLTGIVVVHAGIVRLMSVRLFGVDYPWFLQSGLAGQYLLGPALQPSVFGVLLVTSISAFLHDRPWWAATLAALAGVLHATYLLGAACLMLGFMFVLRREQRGKTALVIGGWALLLVLPAVVYHVVQFVPMSGEAQYILVDIRIPHHAIPARWFDAIAAAQVASMVAALFLVRRDRFFAVLAVPFVLSLLLTLVQVATGSDSLALLFPWRISALLVPVATAIILTSALRNLGEPRVSTPGPAKPGVNTPGSPRYRRAIAGGCCLLLAIAVGGGLVISIKGLAYHTNSDEEPILDFVRTNRERNDVYLIPVTVPKSDPTKKGVFSATFTPAPRASSVNFIPVDFQRFRLDTGAPIVIDYKSIPYRDVEVIEWYRRLLMVEAIYTERDRITDETRMALRDWGVTHIVTTTDRDFHWPGLEAVYADRNYKVYRVDWDAVRVVP
jgi:hypothetical protein